MDKAPASRSATLHAMGAADGERSEHFAEERLAAHWLQGRDFVDEPAANR
jgi:hypothetical protein